MKDYTPKEAKNLYKSLREHLVQKYRERNDLMEQVRVRRFLEKDPEVPEEFLKTAVKHRGSRVFDFVRRCSSLIAQRRPTPHRIPADVTVEAQADSSKVEEFLTAIHLGLDPIGQTFNEIADALASDGMAVWKTVLQRHVWDYGEREEKESPDKYNLRVRNNKRNSLPFYEEFVPGNTYYPLEQGGKPIEVLELSRREIIPLARELGVPLGKLRKIGERAGSIEGNDSFGSEVCDYGEWWTANQVFYFVDDNLATYRTHNYGRVPHSVAYASITSARNPKHRVLPLCYPLLYVQDIEDSLFTIRLNWAYWSGFPAFVLEPLTNEVSFSVPSDWNYEIQLKQGGVLQPPPGFRLTPMQMPSVGPELEQMHRYIKETAEDASLAAILRGVLPGADISGAAALTMIAVAKSILGPAMQSLAHATDEQDGFILECIDKHLKTEVPVYFKDSSKKGRDARWIELGPEDINGYYRVNSKLEPVIPAEQQVKIAMLSTGEQAGYITKRVVREDGYGYEQPEKMGKEVFIERSRQDPNYVQRLWAEFGRWVDEEYGPAPPEDIMGMGTPAMPPAIAGGPGAPTLPGVNQPVAGAQIQQVPPGAPV